MCLCSIWRSCKATSLLPPLTRPLAVRSGQLHSRQVAECLGYLSTQQPRQPQLVGLDGREISFHLHSGSELWSPNQCLLRFESTSLKRRLAFLLSRGYYRLLVSFIQSNKKQWLFQVAANRRLLAWLREMCGFLSLLVLRANLSKSQCSVF